MSDLLSGLGSLGLGGLENMSLYEKEKTGEKAGTQKKAEVKQEEPKEQDFIFDKTYTCPICGHTFKSHTMKSGKARLIGTDQDLRPKYESIDTLKYDVIACPHCGYAALTRYFQILAASQKKAIVEKICASYKPQPETDGDTYSYEEALERYKLALANAIVKSAKPSEKAYICLKSGWLLRGQAESLDETKPDAAGNRKKITESENEFLKNALEGFIAARQTEEYPMCGMDESTVDYLIAALAVRFEQYDTASRLLSAILVSRAANPRMKDKARDLKDILVARIQNQGRNGQEPI